MTPLRLVFLGSDAIALPLLDWLADEGRRVATIVAIFTQPDRPAGRGQIVQANAIKTRALERGIAVHQPEKLTDDVRHAFAALSADVALVMAYGHILRDEFIATPRLGTLNLHASILPRYRGASPIQTAIACGDRETGVTLMRIVRRLDAGPVADIERIPIGALDTSIEVEARLAKACATLLARTLPRLRDGSLNFVEQVEEAATYCRKLEKEDGALDFAAPAAALAARINGLFPWPGCSIQFGGQNIKIGLAEAFADALVPENRGAESQTVAGTILGGAGATGLMVKAGAGVVSIRKLQRPGGKMLPATEFLHGFPMPTGQVIPSAPMRPLVDSKPFKMR